MSLCVTKMSDEDIEIESSPSAASSERHSDRESTSLLLHYIKKHLNCER